MSLAGPRHALVMAASAGLAFAAGTCLAGFLAHNPDYSGDVLLFHDGVCDADLAALRRICPRLIPQPLSEDQILRRLESSGGASPAHLGANLQRFSPYILAKFEIFDWLDRYDHLVWFDLDLLVRARVGHLWQIPQPLGWRALPEKARMRRADQLSTLAPSILAAERPLPNAGVITFHAAPLKAAGVRAATLYDLAAETLAQSSSRTPDELALYLLAARLGLAVAELDLSDNHPVAQEGSETARILHAIGPDKFWKATPLAHACPDWAAHHRLWRAAGGSPAPEPKLHAKVHPLTPSAALSFARNRGYWQALWPKLAPDLPAGLWPELRAERGFLRLHLTGASEALHLDIARGAADRRFTLTVGVEKAAPEAPALIERLSPMAEGLGLIPHDGRRIAAFSMNCSLDGLSQDIHRLTAALREELSR